MPEIKIVTDSTANLSLEFINNHGIKVVPLNIHWGEETSKDGVDITPAQFYARLIKSDEIPKTSQPSMQEFLNAYQEIAPGCEAIIAPIISSGISGTFDSATSAQSEFTEVPLEVVDTKETAAGLALVVIAVVKAIQEGKSLAEVKAVAEDVSSRVRFYFMVDTLEYLHKGGRIGGGRRFLGSALNIKPILYLDDDGKIEALEQVRTKKKALARLVDLAVQEAAGRPVHIGIIHADALADAEEFKSQLAEAVDCKYLEIYDLSPVIGVHVGPGTVGIAIYAEV
ncbi:MAG: DegV family protein [Anaerolineales bacterium]